MTDRKDYHLFADMMELGDIQDLNSCDRKIVRVRISLSALSDQYDKWIEIIRSKSL